ncbi:pilin [Patescibacteria group bacterium]|nr:pilin [Patescibacteria group bacterium]
MKKRIKNLAVTTAALAVSSSRVLAATTVTAPPAFFTDIGSLIEKALNFVLILGALLVFMYLIWGGIEWITSGGDKGKTESARNKITAAVVGLIVVASAWAVLMLVLGFLDTDLDELFTNAGV